MKKLFTLAIISMIASLMFAQAPAKMKEFGKLSAVKEITSFSQRTVGKQPKVMHPLGMTMKSMSKVSPIKKGIAKAEGDYTTLEATYVEVQYFDSDGDWYYTVVVGGLTFYFDIYAGPDPLNGTYTWSQMDSYYSGVEQGEYWYSDYTDATFTIDAEGNIEAMVTLDVDGSKYRIVYTVPEIPEITSYQTFEFSETETDLYDVIASQGVFQIQGDNGGQYVSVAIIANQVAGTYAIEDVYMPYTILYTSVEDESGVKPFALNATVTAEGATIVYDAYDGCEYTLIFHFEQQGGGEEGDAIVTKNAYGIITEVTGGEARVYTRQSSGLYYTSSGISRQSGSVNVIVDGNDFYIKDPISGTAYGAWVKGTLSADGKTLTVPTAQHLSYNSNYKAYIDLTYGDFMGNTFTRNVSKDITYTVEDNTLKLNDADAEIVGSSVEFDAILGDFWSDDNTWQGHGEWSSVLSYDPDYVAPSTDLVELPAGAEVDEWHMNATNILQAGNSPIVNQAVNVAFVGSDVYVQGIFKSMFPNAWIKGTIDGTNITFANVQYIGKDSYGDDTWAQGFNSQTGLCDFTATYDAESKIITGTVDLLANCDVTRAYYDYRYSDIVFNGGEIEEPIITDLTAELPYYNSFDTPAEQAEAKVYDANGDGKTFTFVSDTKTASTTARYIYNSNADGDDYVVFPGLTLKAGKSYKVSVDARANSNTFPERIEVVAGTVAKASGLSTVVVPATVLGGNYQTLTAEFVPEADGVYYIALHCISDADQYQMFADNFYVLDNDPELGYYRNVTVGDYGTICVPGAVDADHMIGAEFYSIENIAENGAITLSSALDELEPGMPYIFKATGSIVACSYTGATVATPAEDEYLTGVFEATAAPVGSYVMQKLNDKIGFYNVVEGQQPTVGANRAYINAESNARVLFFEGDETAINNVKVETNANGAIYNMAGQRVNKAEKGIFIINGKKVIK